MQVPSVTESTLVSDYVTIAVLTYVRSYFTVLVNSPQV